MPTSQMQGTIYNPTPSSFFMILLPHCWTACYLCLFLPSQLLLSDNLTVIETLAAVCKDHHAELACALIQIFCHYNRVLPIVNACLAKSIEKEGTSNVNSPGSMWHTECVCVCVCVCVCISERVVCADNVATLFRASTLATMLMDQLMKLTAMDYLHSVLKDPVQRIADLKDLCEVRTLP